MVHNILALQEEMVQEYEEEAILADGTEVTFRCSEKPVELSLFKETTVIYMFPMTKDGSMLLDTDGDGTLSAQDFTRSLGHKCDTGGECNPDPSEPDDLVRDISLHYLYATNASHRPSYTPSV